MSASSWEENIHRQTCTIAHIIANQQPCPFVLAYTDQLFITPELSKVQIISVPCQITSTIESKWATVKMTKFVVRHNNSREYLGKAMCTAMHQMATTVLAGPCTLVVVHLGFTASGVHYQ